jgi:hypothetical protein
MPSLAFTEITTKLTWLLNVVAATDKDAVEMKSVDKRESRFVHRKSNATKYK